MVPDRRSPQKKHGGRIYSGIGSAVIPENGTWHQRRCCRALLLTSCLNWCYTCLIRRQIIFKHSLIILYCMKFYRAMLCIARVCCRKMSVCPFVTRRYSVEMAKRILKLFSPSRSHNNLVFSQQSVCQYSDVDPRNAGAECSGYENMAIFD